MKNQSLIMFLAFLAVSNPIKISLSTTCAFFIVGAYSTLHTMEEREQGSIFLSDEKFHEGHKRLYQASGSLQEVRRLLSDGYCPGGFLMLPLELINDLLSKHEGLSKLLIKRAKGKYLLISPLVLALYLNDIPLADLLVEYGATLFHVIPQLQRAGFPQNREHQSRLVRWYIERGLARNLGYLRQDQGITINHRLITAYALLNIQKRNTLNVVQEFASRLFSEVLGGTVLNINYSSRFLAEAESAPREYSQYFVRAAFIMAAAQGSLEEVRTVMALSQEFLTEEDLQEAFVMTSFLESTEIAQLIISKSRESQREAWNKIFGQALMLAAVNANDAFLAFVLDNYCNRIDPLFLQEAFVASTFTSSFLAAKVLLEKMSSEKIIPNAASLNDGLRFVGLYVAKGLPSETTFFETILKTMNSCHWAIERDVVLNYFSQLLKQPSLWSNNTHLEHLIAMLRGEIDVNESSQRAPLEAGLQRSRIFRLPLLELSELGKTD